MVIFSKSSVGVSLQNTCSLKRFFLAGNFFHSFFLYPAYWESAVSVNLKTEEKQIVNATTFMVSEPKENRMRDLYITLRLIHRPQCRRMNLCTTDFTDFLFPFFTLMYVRFLLGCWTRLGMRGATLQEPSPTQISNTIVFFFKCLNVSCHSNKQSLGILLSSYSFNWLIDASFKNNWNKSCLAS